MNLARAVARSNNAKVGACAVTYAAQRSCPAACAFKDAGCYAESGILYAVVTKRLNGSAAGASPLDVAHAEAAAIDAMEVIPGRPLRLHSVGDCSTDDAARVVSAAAARYRARGGGPVFTYTHAWRDVERASWGAVSVLASCETAAHVAAARARGYAAAVVVAEFPGRRLYTLSEAPTDATDLDLGRTAPQVGGASLNVLPCPAQTSHATCATCGLCMNDQAILGRGYAIGFEVHGTALAVKKARLSLADPTDESRKLTSRDHAAAFHAEHGRWPTQTELARRAGVSWSSAKEMLAKLKAAA